VFAHFPEIKVVKAALLFVVCETLVKDSYTIENKPELWRKWGAEYGTLQRAYTTNVWNPRPTGLCKAHCVVTECPHNGKR
jgi:hypothetical protein